jgi:hypothetical protein
VLIVTDGQGEPYAVLKPFKLTVAGWVSSGGFSGNGSAKLKLAPRRILIFLARLML